MHRLIEGYRRFRAERWPTERDRYEKLALYGQRPETLVIGCSDSRVDPQTVFGAGPGELFVVRNVAAIVPPYETGTGHHGTSAALEYGVRVLEVKRIVVLGHAQCGGVRAIVEGAPDSAADFIKPWLQLAAPALQAIPEGLDHAEVIHRCEHEVVRLSMSNLLSFPWIKDAVDAGRLEIEGFSFGVANGALQRFDGERFVSVD
ncbi:carbonic anhydrase [Lutibaculum baratangense]|uniref:carbonic anhydrase n=1 Tax=Lutibaculum baratangense AMV1 TaxID=631454 RepID=V4RAC8_9HYPH|nr:carbonic anhydrase [Lutibaculum baratangense]ESR23131.1 Carbonic anhydrase [Lutibaculum baratangense AMV1]